MIIAAAAILGCNCPQSAPVQEDDPIGDDSDDNGSSGSDDNGSSGSDDNDDNYDNENNN